MMVWLCSYTQDTCNLVDKVLSQSDVDLLIQTAQNEGCWQLCVELAVEMALQGNQSFGQKLVNFTGFYTTHALKGLTSTSEVGKSDLFLVLLLVLDK